MIKLQIIGHLGGDCTQNDVNGKKVINFNVAHSEKFKDSKGDLVTRTTWVKCAYWTDSARIAEYLKKGQLIYAEGNPEAEAFMNKDNQAASSLKMRVRDIQLLGGRTDNNSGGNSSGQQSNDQPESVQDSTDDLPF